MGLAGPRELGPPREQVHRALAGPRASPTDTEHSPPLAAVSTLPGQDPGLWGPVRTEGAHSLPARPSGGPAASASAWTRSRPSGPRAPLLPFLSDTRRPHGLSASAVPVTNGHPASLIVLLSVEGNGAHFPGPWRRQGSHPPGSALRRRLSVCQRPLPSHTRASTCST